MSSLQRVYRGRVWKFGDSVDTNQMAPGGLAEQGFVAPGTAGRA